MGGRVEEAEAGVLAVEGGFRLAMARGRRAWRRKSGDCGRGKFTDSEGSNRFFFLMQARIVVTPAASGMAVPSRGSGAWTGRSAGPRGLGG
ncbi:unnamed protein product [Chondrus crispus]|uniref:Uncharacterized protein n=1 Tax=Chondrus crispus TaxID=2769 RepID=R7QG33_CHOCR|nr:unnamed protein product [Chondrus crispus]CDF36385.1 unnamed protein product [Chondrus crispus]|eukprot:XP_005716204.1 unnamed protein product [Chondrus crispus]